MLFFFYKDMAFHSQYQTGFAMFGIAPPAVTDNDSLDGKAIRQRGGAVRESGLAVIQVVLDHLFFAGYPASAGAGASGNLHDKDKDTTFYCRGTFFSQFVCFLKLIRSFAQNKTMNRLFLNACCFHTLR